jgi:predicted metalloenzyme YecM
MDILTALPVFVDEVMKSLDELGVKVDSFEMDHCCYRVESDQEYAKLKQELQSIGVLLKEDLIGGRFISTFKLHECINLEKHNRSLSVIELPSPKAGSFYPSGFEHVEFAVGNLDLVNFTESYPHLQWDMSGLKKSFNADVRLELVNLPKKRINVKFHQLPLEKVIELEDMQR